MKKIIQQLEKIKQENRTGLMTHVVAGCPTMPMTEKIIEQMAKSGADFIEIQIPFSDPVADGPVMMEANEIALQNKTKVKDAFTLAKKMIQKIDIPLLFMGYFNNVYKMGVEKFCEEARKAGISGLIFPDIPFDEAKNEHFLKAIQKNDLAFIQVVSEITSEKRLKKIKKTAQGFIYCTARLGITGLHAKSSNNLGDYLEKVRKNIGLPLAVGFGISSKEDVQKIAPYAEIAVIGSAIMKITLDKKLAGAQKLKQINEFIKKIK